MIPTEFRSARPAPRPARGARRRMAPAAPFFTRSFCPRDGAAFLALLLCFSALGCDRGPEGRPDLILVTVDTLRADHLGLYGYARPTSPQLDAFFEKGAIFERAYSTEANTPPSVMSILSGRPPRLHGVRSFYQLAPDDVPLLPDRLPAEYQSAAFVSNIVLTEEALGIATRFDHFDDFVDEPESDRDHIYERNARRTTDAALAWLRASRDTERPLFLWVHYIDPHGPYSPPSDAPQRFSHEGFAPVPPKGRIRPYQVDPDVVDALDYVDRYDEEIAYADAQIGRLFAGLATLLDLDTAFVLFTADHGESMREHGRWFTHGYHVWEEIIRVPLLLRGPGVTPGRRTGLVSGIDVMPTLLAAAGVPSPATPPDDPLARAFDLRRDDPPADRVVYAEASLDAHRWRAGRRGDDKWIFANLGDRVIPQLHFDLTEDPEELRRRPWFAAPPPDELMALLKTDPAAAPSGERAGRQLDGPKIDPRVSDRQRRQLEALGYGRASEAPPAAD